MNNKSWETSISRSYSSCRLHPPFLLPNSSAPFSFRWVTALVLLPKLKSPTAPDPLPVALYSISFSINFSFCSLNFCVFDLPRAYGFWVFIRFSLIRCCVWISSWEFLVDSAVCSLKFQILYFVSKETRILSFVFVYGSEISQSSSKKHNPIVPSYNPNSVADRNDNNDVLNLPTPRTEGEILSSSNLKPFHFNELKNATRNFRPDSLLGEGGFGYVFKGWIDENTLGAARPGLGMVVAVKKLKAEASQGHKEWLVRSVVDVLSCVPFML